MKILIVDDEYNIREGLRDTIDWTALGFATVMTAKNGIEALQIISKMVPDILLTDIRMPGMDGLELASQVSSLFPEIKIILLSGYTDFSYAKQAISIGVEEYFIKPVNIEELLSKIEEISKERKNKAASKSHSTETVGRIESLIHTDFSTEKIKDILTSLKMKWRMPYLLAGIVEISKPAESDIEKEKTVIFESSFLQAVFFPGEKRESVFFYSDTENKYCFFLNVLRSNECLEIAGELSRTITTLSDRYDIIITAALSDAFSSLHFCQAYQDAKRTFEHQFFIGKGVLLTSSQFRHKVFETPLHPDSIKNLLVEAIRIADIKQCLHIMQPLFQSYRFAGIEDIPVICAYCFELVTILSSEISKNAKDNVKDNILKMGYIVHAEKFTTLEEFIQQVSFFYCDIMDILKISQISKSKWIVEKAKDYMAASYQKVMTVEEIAQHVDRNPNYLCHIFNSIEGVSITEYLNQLRIEKAKKLLKTTSLMSYEIAEKVGFVNYRYFTQIFKKYTGLSPTGYRNSLLS